MSVTYGEFEDQADELLTADDVHSVNDLMLAVAQALETRNHDLVCMLRRKVSDWLQMRHERDAQLALLDATEAAIVRLEMHEG